MVAVNIQSVIEWLNRSLPHLNLPTDASEEKLRAYLIGGTVLCNILDKLCPGLVEMVGLLSYWCFCCLVLVPFPFFGMGFF